MLYDIQNATECTILRPSEKQFSGGGGGGTNPRPSTVFSLSRVGMYADSPAKGLTKLLYIIQNVIPNDVAKIGYYE